MVFGQAVEANVFNPSTREAEAKKTKQNKTKQQQQQHQTKFGS